MIRSRSCEFLYHMHNYVFKCWKQISLRRLMSTASVHHIFKNIKFRRFNEIFQYFENHFENYFLILTNFFKYCLRIVNHEYWMIECCNDGSQSTFMYIQPKYGFSQRTNRSQLAEEHVKSKIWFSLDFSRFKKSVMNSLKINSCNM